MRLARIRIGRRGGIGIATLAAAVLALLAPGPARAGRLSWLDDVVREVVREAEAGGKAVARSADDAARAGGRLFVREAAEESLEVIARRADDLAEAGAKGVKVGATPSEALLKARFGKLVGDGRDFGRTFAALAPAEKRLVVEMGETARRLALRYPGQAEPLIRELGTEGLTAVRVFGDDVAVALAKEGPTALGVLKKSGRTGWEFFTTKVLPNKGKLAAAGVLALFLADPDRFVDSAGKATEYAVREFTKAGVALAGAVGGGAVRGVGGLIGSTLGVLGIGPEAGRAIGIGLAVLVVALSLLALIGAPLRWLVRPFTWIARLARGKKAIA